MYSHSTNTSDWPKGLVFLHDWKRRNQRQGSSGHSGAQWGSCNRTAKFTRPKDGLLASYTSKSSRHLHFQGWSCIYLYTHIYTHTCIWYFMVFDFFMPGFAFCTPERFTPLPWFCVQLPLCIHSSSLAFPDVGEDQSLNSECICSAIQVGECKSCPWPPWKRNAEKQNGCLKRPYK